MKLFGRRTGNEGRDHEWTLAKGLIEGHPTIIQIGFAQPGLSSPSSGSTGPLA